MAARTPVRLTPIIAARSRCDRGGSPERSISKVVPSLVYNTVDQPIFPTTGRRVTASFDLAGLGGNTNFLQADGRRRLVPAGRTPGCRSACARRSSTSAPTAARIDLPIFEKLFLGGEYSVRGFDIRTIGPRDPITGLVLGGNKSLLFNVERSDHDRRAGAPDPVLRRRPGARHRASRSRGRKTITRVVARRPAALDPFATVGLTDPSAPSGVRPWSSASRAPSRRRPAPRSGSSCRC